MPQRDPLTLPSGWTMFNPIWRSTVRSGWSQVISSLFHDIRHRQRRHRSVRGKDQTYTGNSPLQRAIYSFLMFPPLNSADSSLAVWFDSPRIINPEVSLSKRFTAGWNNGFSTERNWCDQTDAPTVYLFVAKLALENFHKRMSEISSRCVDRLENCGKRGLYRRRSTHYAPRFIDDDKFPFSIVMDDFHRFRSDGGFVPVHNVPGPEVQSHPKHRSKVRDRTLFGHRSGLWYRVWRFPR